jgi:hypothetical protein
VWHAFLDRYFPYQVPEGQKVASADQDAKDISGNYIVSRRGGKSILKMLAVAGQMKVARNEDGSVSASDLKGMNGEPIKFREFAPLEFREVNGQDKLAFKRDADGTLVAVIDFPFMVFHKAAWYENGAFQLPLLYVSLGILLLAVLLWPVMALVRKHYGKPLTLTPEQKRVRLLVRLACLAPLVFVGGYLLFFTVALKDIGMFSPRGNPWIRLIQLFGWLGVVGMFVALYSAFRSWKEPGRWVWSRVGETLIALAFVGMVWFTFTWNLLHWSLTY